jgi:porin
MQSLGLKLEFFQKCVIFCVLTTPLIVFAQQPSLPLPAHPERLKESPEHTAPRESQPGRESRKMDSIPSRGPNVRRPIPGQPSRNLPPVGGEEAEADGEAGAEDAEVEESLEEEELGLIRRLPHSLRDGAWTLEYIYTGESFTKAHGGLSSDTATNYRSNTDIVSIIDTERMNWWEGGRIFVYGQNVFGKTLSSRYVGDTQLFSNIDSTISDDARPHFTSIAEYWYEHFTGDNRWRFKIGKQDANADFAYSDLGGEFVHSSFGLPPMIPLPTFPSQALGVATFLNLTEGAAIGVGVYDGTAPDGPQGVRWGFDTLGHNGAISLFQLELKPQLGKNGQLPNSTRVGMWHHSDSDVWTEYTTDPSPRTFVQNYGFWSTMDQLIWKEEYGTDDEQGLGLFGMFGWAPGNRNAIQESYGLGVVYKGLLPNRDFDVFGIGMADILFSGPYRQVSLAEGTVVGSYENAIEVFYKYIASPYISVQPDIQFIANPSGQYRDALVPGLRFEVVL